MKIAIYAGTFDPVHNGHIEFAKKASEAGDLDKVVIVAEKEPYRKKPVASWDHRQAMIERATNSLDNIDHNYAFANELAHKHTMKDMLLVAKKHYGSDNEFWFLTGSDVFEHIHQWRDILSKNHYGGFVVAIRDDHTDEWLHQKLDVLEGKISKRSVLILKSNYPRISSSQIRRDIKTKTAIKDLPLKVLDYALNHKLYR